LPLTRRLQLDIARYRDLARMMPALPDKTYPEK
jgi:hypothetical protein